MLDYLLLILFISLLCNGVDLITSDGYLFHPFRLFLSRSFLREPLIGCIVCMASIWGSFFYWLLYFIFGWENQWEMFPIVILCVAVINPIIANKIDGK